MTDSLLSAAHSLLPDAVRLRREIHRHPELGNDLPRTKASVLAALDDLDLTIHHSTATSGLVAVLESLQSRDDSLAVSPAFGQPKFAPILVTSDQPSLVVQDGFARFGM